MSKNGLEALREHTVIVADSGEFGSFEAHAPTDATTNPTLILQAASSSNPLYTPIVERVVARARSRARGAESVAAALGEVAVEWGLEILKRVPGRVSTEVDARLSFDAAATARKAREAVALYEAAGVSRERVLVKIAATWEGVQACRELERDGIHCNMTLIFSAVQAMACADAGATLISPFVGRITDYCAQREGRKTPYDVCADPGVLSVARIHAAFKARGARTQVMGASFRTKEQVLALAGCDLLTVAPKLLTEIQQLPASAVTRQLGRPGADAPAGTPAWLEGMGEAQFRLALNNDEMATVKLAEGIRRFCADIDELEKRLAALIL